MLKPIEVLARELSKFPGIGHKSATRIALHVVNMDVESVENLSKAFAKIKESILICKKCFSYAYESTICATCLDSSRHKKIICVLEKPQDVFTFERGEFKGMYHILHGLISPLDGVGPDDIYLKELLHRIETDNINEIIIALNSGVEGDATTLYIAKLLEEKNIKVSRLARGVPAGASIDYVDDLTLSRAIEERQKVLC